MLDSYSFKTDPWDCQRTALERSAELEYFGLRMEQGTGKTKVILDNAAWLYGLGRINALVVIAPNGVHRNWIRKEIPLHLPDYVPTRCAWWASSPNKKETIAMEELWKPGQALRVFTLNIEALALDRCLKEVIKFLQLFDCMVVVDESHRIKNISAKTTKNILKLRPLAKYRRFCTGTMIANAPMDAFPQLSWLDPSILPTQSFVAFRARYAEIMPQDHPLIRAIMRKTGKAFGPVMIATDIRGQPIYKNLDELREIVEKHTYRVLKKDALDLPPKIYARRPVELHADQKAMYKKLVDRLKNGPEAEDLFREGPPQMVAKLNAVMYFQQILSGIVPTPFADTPKQQIWDDPEKNPRLQELLRDIAETDESCIIWARFTADVLNVAAALRKHYGDDSVALYYGDVKDADRDIAEDDFQAGRKRFLVGNAAAGGTGLTLHKAGQMHYYSNSFKLLDRLQSEDRAHRGGLTHPVRYVDYEVEGSVDTKILNAFLNKKNVADAIQGDDFSQWIQI